MRFAFLFGLLALAACDADTFTGGDTGTNDDGGKDDAVAMPDAEGIDVQADVAAEVGPTEASTGDASVSKSVLCSNSVCSDVCCGGLTAWGGPFCQPASAENTTLCTNWLECNDATDCPGNETCCATQTFNKLTGVNDLDHSYCAQSCMAVQGAFQLCSQGSECVAGSCKAYVGDPNWVKTCQ